MTDFSLLEKIICEHNSFVLSTHVNPDADALGSELAFYFVLKKLGKQVRVINHSATPYNLEFLDDQNILEKYDETTHSEVFDRSEVFILLDLNQANRIVKMEKELRSFKGLRVCIDHHQGTEDIFDHVFGGTEYSATSEIIYDLIDETKIVELDYAIALQLYAGIMTDTGSFRFDRTSPRIHQIMAELLEKGVNPTDVYDKIYDQFKFGRVKLLGYALSTIMLEANGRIAYMIIKREQLEQTGATEADIDGFVNYCLTIKGVQIGILFYELKDGIKISFRSKGDISVGKLAKEFDGGGHTNASGIRLFNTTIDQVKEKIISAAQRYL